MKRAVRLVFIVQLIVLTILGAVIYFQNSYVRLFYKDISYIDVLVSDDKAFNAFLSWTEERGIIVSRISINPDNEITLHVSDWASHHVLFLSLLNHADYGNIGTRSSPSLSGSPNIRFIFCTA